MAKHPSIAVAEPSRLTREVLDDLRKTPKQLSPVWFYDENGSNLFERICELPEYYLTRAELAIMRLHAAEMASQIGPGAAVIELGSGSSLKTRLLLDQLTEAAAYVPVDISREHLLDTAGVLARDYPALNIAPVYADFTQPFALPPELASARTRVVYFPGSTIGNFEIEQAQRLLGSMHDMARGGWVLIGIDLKKDPEILERAYDDAAGVTAQFNLNALRHVNRELHADFDMNAFAHQAVWVEEESRIEMHLVSQHQQTVHVAGEPVHFARGEHLRTECCHKYTLESFRALAARANLSLVRAWNDPEDRFSVMLLKAASH
jgi:dimethylhistidine N-methyltransferase